MGWKQKKYRARSAYSMKGFALMEVCIGLIIIGMLTAGLFSLLEMVRQRQHTALAGQQHERILRCLAQYAYINNYLPCPADPRVPPEERGQALPTCDTREASVGLVPFQTLGIPEEHVKSTDGVYLTYAATLAGTNMTPFSTPTLPYTPASGEHTLHPFCTYAPPPFPLRVVRTHGYPSAFPEDVGAGNPVVVVLVTHSRKGAGGYLSSGRRRGEFGSLKGEMRINEWGGMDFINHKGVNKDVITWARQKALFPLYIGKSC